MTKLPRSERNYVVTGGVLNAAFRQNPNRRPAPFSRPVIDSGTAYKTVYLSRAPLSLDNEGLVKALERHEFLMRKELQDRGYIVRKTIRTVAGLNGDIRVQMLWEKLGEKRTKEFRKAQKHVRVSEDAGSVGTGQGSETEPGRAPIQTDSEEGPVPL
jgi:hypothetical protein